MREPAAAELIEQLPPGLRQLYRTTDGIDIHHIRFGGEIVGTALQVLPAAEVVPIDHAMYGSNSETKEWIGRDWLAVARGSDSAFYIALSTADDAYYSVSPIVRDEAERIASSSPEFFAWLLGYLPSSAQLNAAAQQGAA